jgi:hypothetical protein
MGLGWKEDGEMGTLGSHFKIYICCVWMDDGTDDKMDDATDGWMEILNIQMGETLFLNDIHECSYLIHKNHIVLSKITSR